MPGRPKEHDGLEWKVAGALELERATIGSLLVLLGIKKIWGRDWLQE